MPRLASTALMPLAEARDCLLALVQPVPPRSVELEQALGRIVADDIVGGARPLQPVALRDGWAVEAAAIVGASPYAPVAIPEPVWVERGAPMPDTCDCILPREALEIGAGTFEVVADASPGEGVRRAGDEQRGGEIVAAAGTSLTALRCAALAVAGIAALQIRAPRVAILVTGSLDEDIAGSVLAGCVSADGGLAQVLGVPRDLDGLTAALASCAADAIIVLGGTAFGRNDHAGAALAAAGECLAHGIALKPGDTAGFGRVGTCPVLLIPRRLDAALAGYIALGRPLLAALAAAQPPMPVMLRLGRKVASAIGLTEVIFARRADGGVVPVGGAGLPMRLLSLAEGAVLVPPESEGYPDGAVVEVVGL